MDMRLALERDIPAIVDFLKKTLGEALLPKSEAYWRWKHLDNPFGASPVLLMFEGDTLVGVRAFMRWQWQKDGKILEAVRPVDTATHPDFQRRGIFRTLTLSLIEYCQEHGWDVVFNTPNQNSRPGNLKMGWREAGKLPVHFQLLNPVSMVLAKAGRKRERPIAPDDLSVAEWLAHPGVPALLAGSEAQNTRGWHTPHTPASLSWRYAQVPVVKYAAHALVAGGNLQALAFYRLKSSGLGVEFRVTDLFVSPGVSEKQLASWIRQEARRREADYITVSGYNVWYKGRGLLNFRNLRVGPGVTIRSLSSEEKLVDLAAFRAWRPSLGDLELF